MAKSKVSGAARDVHKRNFFFYMIYPYVKAFFFKFYGKVEVTGLENIPRNEPVIMAPNHQNALMDALILLYSAPQDIVFLARADIFKNRVLAFFLNSMKMLPVFRQRDGASELGKNMDIFDISVNVLHNRHFLCVMPEGNHGSLRRLRTIMKGIFRIGFKAQEEFGNKPFVKILPVGFDVGDYIKQNQTLLIQYGKPIELSEYWEQYQENNARGINAMKARLREEMLPLMINIGNEEHYEAIYVLKGIFNDTMREIMGIKGKKLSDRFKADKELIASVDSALEKETSGKVSALMEKVVEYDAGVKKLNIRDWVVAKKGYTLGQSLLSNLLLLPTLPFFLYGLINNAIPYFLPVRMERNMKDRQFHSSVKLGLGILVFFPLVHGLQALLVGILTASWWIWAVYLASLYPMGKVALAWYGLWKKKRRGSWFRRQLIRSKPEALQLVKLRKEIIEECIDLVCK